jgi:4-hydroxymandelate oxidase
MTRWTDTWEAEAAERLNPVLYAYFRQGAGAETALGEARAAWDGLRLRPRVLRDVSAVTTGRTVLGTPVSTPVLAAPSALQHRAHPGGVTATAQGVAKAGSLVCVSSSITVPYTAVRDTGAPWWAQVYVLRDRGLTRALLERAREAGARAVVLTADTPVLGARAVKEPELVAALGGERVTYYGGAEVAPQVLRQASDLTFRDIEWVASASGLPVLVKGVLRGDDARAAIDAGAAGIVVSNHGGRQLDTALPTARALPDVADALAGTDAEVYVDGGIRTGAHVLAALALGARAVLVGRPVLWALATRGADGVAALVSGLTEELRLAFALTGATGPEDVGADLLEPDSVAAWASSR